MSFFYHQSCLARRIKRGIAVCCLVLPAHAAHAEYKGEFLAFPSVTAAHRTGILPGDELEKEHLQGAVNILATGNFDAFQFLGELNYASDDKDLARLYMGLHTDAGTLISVGKFHNLQGYWNTQFHHGVFLQNTISRPGIIEHDGPLPGHYLGLQLDGKATVGNGAVNYSIGIGRDEHFATHLESHENHPPDHNTGRTLGLRMSYSPEEGDPNQAGLFAASNTIPIDIYGLTGIKQLVWGAFGNWEYDAYRVIGEIYAFKNVLSGDCAPCTGTFTNAYVQGEYRATPAFTAYGRLEDTSGGVDDAFLAIVPEFAKRRTVAGLRYDLTDNQSVKLEISRTGRVESGFDQLQLQWSAVFQ